MTKIRIFDEPCGSGKSSQLIKELQLIKQNKLKGGNLIVVPYLSEVDRFQDELGDGWLVAPIEGEGRKIDQLIEAMERGRNIITTHALYEHIRQFSHLLFMYDVVIDEVPTTTKQIPVSFGKVEFRELIEDNYITVDKDTKLMTVANNWKDIVSKYDAGDRKDKQMAKFLSQVAHTEVYHMSGTYCLMPLPDAFFTEPKHLHILTFLFEGTQLDHYMRMRGYDYELERDKLQLESFKWGMFRNIEFYPKTSKAKTGYVALSSRDDKHRKTVGNFIVKAIKYYRANGVNIQQSDILIGSHKDAWFGKSKNFSSTVSDATSLMKLTKLPDATYTPLITRGTNQHSKKTVMLILGTENLNPNVAEYLGMNNSMSVCDHRLSELIQLIYRTAIRTDQKIIIICPDSNNIELLKLFIGYESKVKQPLNYAVNEALKCA